MKEWTRELLFAAEVPEQEPPPKRSRTGQTRVWKSVLDIPPGTLVNPEEGMSHLYITTRRSGWWMSANSQGRFDIARVEADGDGWPLTDERSYRYRGPFTEVLP